MVKCARAFTEKAVSQEKRFTGARLGNLQAVLQVWSLWPAQLHKLRETSDLSSCRSNVLSSTCACKGKESFRVSTHATGPRAGGRSPRLTLTSTTEPAVGSVASLLSAATPPSAIVVNELGAEKTVGKSGSGFRTPLPESARATWRAASRASRSRRRRALPSPCRVRADVVPQRGAGDLAKRVETARSVFLVL